MSEIAFFLLGDLPASIHEHEHSKHLCGYLGVPKDHPWYGKDYDEVDVEVHGGLTYYGQEHVSYRGNSERGKFLLEKGSKDWTEEEHQRYDAIPRWEASERDTAFPHNTGLDVWWFGFDCAHYDDWTIYSPDGIYRDEAYVRLELENLAKQAMEATNREEQHAKTTV